METILETPRLILRELTPDDFTESCLLLQDDAVMYAYEGAFSDIEVHEWLGRQLARYTSDGFGLWGVVLKETGEMIGQCGLTLQSVNGATVTEIGYLLRKEFWHKGYATEAAQACKKYAFEQLGVQRVYSIIRDSNTASQNIARRNGMTPVTTIVKHYRGINMSHIVFAADRTGGL